MLRNTRPGGTSAALVCSRPLIFGTLILGALTLGAPAAAVAGSRHYDDRDWYGRHHHYGYGHDYGRHHHRGSGVSGVFIWDATPPPPPVMVVPGPVVVQQPPIVVQAPPAGYCREYTAPATVDGRTVETWGTACRQPDGSWRIVSRN